MLILAPYKHFISFDNYFEFFQNTPRYWALSNSIYQTFFKQCSWIMEFGIYNNQRSIIWSETEYHFYGTLSQSRDNPPQKTIRTKICCITHVCVCALNSGRGSLQNLTQVCDTERAALQWKDQAHHNWRAPLQRDFSFKRGELMGRGAAWQ